MKYESTQLRPKYLTYITLKNQNKGSVQSSVKEKEQRIKKK